MPKTKTNTKSSKSTGLEVQASKMGLSIEEAISKILNAPEGTYASEVVEKANRARNFAYAYGGLLMEENKLNKEGSSMFDIGGFILPEYGHALSEYGFGSWLKNNAGGLLKGAGSLVGAIPLLGKIAGPVLNLAGAAVDGVQEKKRAQGEADELQAQYDAEAAAQKQQNFIADSGIREENLFGGQENVNYGGTFEKGGTLGEPDAISGAAASINEDAYNYNQFFGPMKDQLIKLQKYAEDDHNGKTAFAAHFATRDLGNLEDEPLMTNMNPGKNRSIAPMNNNMKRTQDFFNSLSDEQLVQMGKKFPQDGTMKEKLIWGKNLGLTMKQIPDAISALKFKNNNKKLFNKGGTLENDPQNLLTTSDNEKKKGVSMTKGSKNVTTYFTDLNVLGRLKQEGLIDDIHKTLRGNPEDWAHLLPAVGIQADQNGPTANKGRWRYSDVVPVQTGGISGYKDGKLISNNINAATLKVLKEGESDFSRKSIDNFYNNPEERDIRLRYAPKQETYLPKQETGGDLLMNSGENMEDNVNPPNIVEYGNKANKHSEGIGGVPVDIKGNPTKVSKQSAVGMTESGEVTWNGYVFSNKLKVK